MEVRGSVLLPSKLHNKSHRVTPRWQCCAGCYTTLTEDLWRLQRAQRGCQQRDDSMWEGAGSTKCWNHIIMNMVWLLRHHIQVKVTPADKHSPLPPNTWMSSCSKRYMTNVFTCGSSPIKNTMGKHRIKTAGRQKVKLTCFTHIFLKHQIQKATIWFICWTVTKYKMCVQIPVHFVNEMWLIEYGLHVSGWTAGIVWILSQH